MSFKITGKCEIYIYLYVQHKVFCVIECGLKTDEIDLKYSHGNEYLEQKLLEKLSMVE